MRLIFQPTRIIIINEHTSKRELLVRICKVSRDVATRLIFIVADFFPELHFTIRVVVSGVTDLVVLFRDRENLILGVLRTVQAVTKNVSLERIRI